jgi:DNA-binding MarR family transcriptional regulator
MPPPEDQSDGDTITPDEPDWDDISYVISSQYRRMVLGQLYAGPATPSQLADDTGHAIANVSRALRQLRDRGLVDLLVSEDRRKGRVYGITDTGRLLWEKLVSEGLV